MYDSASDDLSALQSILEECINGRTEGHDCPFCKGGPLKVQADEDRVRLECPSCRKFFEGRVA